MRCWNWARAATVGLILTSSAVMAGDRWDEFWHRVHVDFLRNNSWPEPFQTVDRGSTREPWCIQTDNGWKMQNTVGRYR